MKNPYKLVLLACVTAFSLSAAALFQPEPTPVDLSQAPRLGVLYAAPVERVETHVLGTGQTLTGVLAQARINGQEMADVLLGLRRHVNPRRLSAQTEVTVRRWRETGETRAVEIRMDPDSTIRLVKHEVGWDGEVVVTPVRWDTVFASGVIERGKTLYETVLYDDRSGLSVRERLDMVIRLASVYEFKFDFSREIQPGDSYRVVYEREVRPDGSSRSAHVLAAEMVTRGVPVAAYWFDGGKDIRGYFDAEARPLATGFLKMPIEFARITSSFNPRRYHPVLGVYRAHQGTDFGASTGTPVRATADGTVTFAGVRGGYGNVVEIRHHSGYSTRYAHLSRFGSGIRAGARVSQKQVIGLVGKTGLATGPHLHYEMLKNGSQINAMRATLPGAPPIPGVMKQRFLAVALERSTLLERVPAAGAYATTKPAKPAANVTDEI